MINQKIDIEEPYIDQTFDEDQKAKGTFNELYDLVMNQTENQNQFLDNGETIGEDYFQEEDKEDEEPQLMNSNLLFSRNNIENSKELSKLKENIFKSREIHRKLINKKNRWKPSELELAVLKLHFDKNKYPSKEEKEMLLRNLEENFNSNIEISQLNRWFQHEREKSLRHGFRNSSKNTYKKFGKEELDYLKDKFSYNTYPKTEEMMEMSKVLGVSLSKIENWYKHNRRSLAKKGAFTLKTKKYFKKEEVGYLLKMFEVFPRPTKEQISDMAEHLKCSELQIKNWYSNKRKKQKLMAKKQGNETIETQLHQPLFQNFPQFTPQQPNDLYVPLPTNSNGIQMNVLPQKTDMNNTMPNLIQARPLNSFQNPQMMNSFPNLVFANPSMINGGSTTNEFPQVQLNTAGSFANGAVPVFLIPVSSLGGLPQQPLVSQNGFNSLLFQNQDEVKLQPQQPFILKNNQGFPIQTQNTPIISFNNMMQQQPVLSSIPNALPTFNSLKQNDPNMGTADMTGGSWMNGVGVQPMQSSNPIIILSNNKTQTIQNQPMSFNFQTQPTGFQPTNINTGNINSQTFISGNFNQNGNTGPGFPQYEQPMQIQYLTSLYCPYSNNNIFSNYPVVYQGNPNGQLPTTTTMTNGKQTLGIDPLFGANSSFNQQMPAQNMHINAGAFRNPDPREQQYKT